MKKRKEDGRTILLCSLAVVAKQETEKGPVSWSHHLPGEGVKPRSSGTGARGSEALGLKPSSRGLDFSSRGRTGPQSPPSLSVGRGSRPDF